MSILVVAAHPDDEALGCAGTIARHCAGGDEVNIIFLADGEFSRGDARASQLSARRKSACDAAQVLGANEPYFFDFPDNKLDSVAMLDIVQAIEKVSKDIKPRVIYTHHAGDLNIDHTIAAQATLTAHRPQPGSQVQAIYGFEVLSSTDWAGAGKHFCPSYFVDISGVTEKKIAALKCYEAEMHNEPHARSIASVKALWSTRGMVQGLAAAEAFTVLRQYWFK